MNGLHYDHKTEHTLLLTIMSPEYYFFTHINNYLVQIQRKVLETYDMHQSVPFKVEVRDVWRDTNTPTPPMCFII